MKDLYAKERAEQQLKNKEKQEQKDFFEKLFLSHKKELEELLKKNKSVDGYTPKKGTDYFTDAEIEALKKDVLAQIPTPENGKDAEVNYDLVFAYVIEQVSKIPKPKDGEPGKDAVVDTAQIVADVLKQIPKTEKLKVDYAKIQELIDEKVKNIPWNEKRVVGYSSLKQLTDVVLDGIPQDSKGNYILTPQVGIADTFETVSKNLDASNATLNYTGENLTSIEYANGIIKTLAYTGDNLTSIVLSGSTPSGITLTKTFTYTGENLTGVVYS